MSRLRNRSVKTLPLNIESGLENSLQIPLSSSKKENCINRKTSEDPINESVTSSGTFYTHKINESIYETLSTISSGDSSLDINKFSRLSSASSVSWNDEFEVETRKKVLSELETLHRVFCGLEQIPAHYDKEELAEWATYFPNISILGTSTPMNSPRNSSSNSDSEEETSNRTLLLQLPANDFIYTSINTVSSHKRVSQRICNKLSDRTFPQKQVQHTRHRRKPEDTSLRKSNFIEYSQNIKSLDIDKYLKISPLKSPKCRERKHSSKSLYENKEVGKQDFLEETSVYNSLPYIDISNDLVKRSLKSNENRKRINGMLRKRSEQNLILPPITNSNYLRSISATPGQPKKSLSALLFENKCRPNLANFQKYSAHNNS